MKKQIKKQIYLFKDMRSRRRGTTAGRGSHIFQVGSRQGTILLIYTLGLICLKYSMICPMIYSEGSKIRGRIGIVVAVMWETIIRAINNGDKETTNTFPPQSYNIYKGNKTTQNNI